MQVRLVTPDLAQIEAAIAGRQPLERALGCEVAEGWDVFPESLPRARDHLAADPARGRWGMRLFLVGEPPTLVGWGGFKGMPRDGTVELGYAVAPSWEGRGIATAAVNAMLDEAFADPEVLAVIAHTLAEPGPSPRVLEKAGFAHAGAIAEGDDGVVWRYRRER